MADRCSRAEQRTALDAFSRAATREVHNLAAAALDRYPQFVWQQLYNRLQCDADILRRDDEGETPGDGAARLLDGLLEPEFARRSVAATPLWLHLRTRLTESEALIRCPGNFVASRS